MDGGHPLKLIEIRNPAVAHAARRDENGQIAGVLA